MDNGTHTFFSGILRDYKNLDKMKLKTKEWFSKNFKTDTQALIIHNKSYENKSEEYIELSINISKFTIWMSDEDMIDYSNCLYILEDIFETFPIKDMELLFDIIENNLKAQLSKSIEVFNQKRKLVILRISNTILKRLSSSMDTQFKGRIQMALASVFPISDKSGVNLKGLYNKNNYSFTSKHEDNSQLNSQKLINQKFYKQFWILLKFISNPLSIFNNENNEITDTIESLDETKEIILLENDIPVNKFDIFLGNINKVISFFDKNKINLNDKSESILTYPKYLTSPDLFDLQLSDSSFRKTILLQFLIVLKSFLKPISQIQKKNFILTDKDKVSINEIIQKIINLINPMKEKNHYFELIINNEEMWEKWKEGGCQTYEKVFDENQNKDFQKIVQEYEKKNNEIKEKKFVPIKTRCYFKLDNLQNSETAKILDFNLDDLTKYEVQHTYTGGIQSDNPFLGDYLEKVLRDNDPTNEIDENLKISVSDPTFNWKFMRLIAQNDISKLYQEKIENIIKEYTDTYGIKLPPVNNFEKSHNLILTPTPTTTPILPTPVVTNTANNNSYNKINLIQNNLENMNINEIKTSNFTNTPINNLILDLQDETKEREKDRDKDRYKNNKDKFTKKRRSQESNHFTESGNKKSKNN